MVSDNRKRRILRIVLDSRRRLTRPMLERAVLRDSACTRSAIRSAIRELMESGQLVYTYEHGCSFVEQSMDRPVRIDEKVILCPPRTSCQPEASEVVVTIRAGAAFGNGRHPSTRAAVRCLTHLLKPITAGEGLCPGSVLDIGTGSGILLMVSLYLGVHRALGIDTDPCAVAEARENLRLNGLSDRAEISQRPFSSIVGPFGLITANLRYPTLIRYAGAVAALLEHPGFVVLSGLKTEEIHLVMKAYIEHRMELVFQVTEKDWVGAVFRKE